MFENLFKPTFFNDVLIIMACLAPVVFICLHKVTAGYGMMRSSGWGPSVSNRLGWVVMEAPSFLVMLFLWLASERVSRLVPVVMASFFLVHYFQRSFIFPLLIRGRSRMPWAIVIMGIVFNVINAYLIGGWIFYVSPASYYPDAWLRTPQFIFGTILFFGGMVINLQSDKIVRGLRKPGDTAHYIPKGGMYRYVTSANYFGEFMEWTGFAVLSWSWAGVVFAVWTFANLAPRARSLHRRYLCEFGREYADLHRRYILPFLY